MAFLSDMHMNLKKRVLKEIPLKLLPTPVPLRNLKKRVLKGSSALCPRYSLIN